MNSISDLSESLRTMNPMLNPGTFVFASVKPGIRGALFYNALTPGLRNRATMVTNVVKPTAVQPVHADGLQSRPKSDLLHDFTMAASSRPG